jgi:hypothetical protein
MRVVNPPAPLTDLTQLGGRQCDLLDLDDLAHNFAGVSVLTEEEQRELAARIDIAKRLLRIRREQRRAAGPPSPPTSGIREYWRGDLVA